LSPKITFPWSEVKNISFKDKKVQKYRITTVLKVEIDIITSIMGSESVRTSCDTSDNEIQDL